MDQWLEQSAAELGRAIGRGDLDARDLTEAYLDRIAGHEMADRIYARLTPERARAEAAAAQDRAVTCNRLSPLDGVPVSWKDLFDTAGVATEAGSALLEGRVPARDARVLRNATALGLVCLGKTHMSELAFSGLGHNPVTATPPCVNDHDAVSGGSSSGAAASVAFGLAAAALGSDTGGSVRVPAAWNDLAGLKTTAGRVSLDGVVPLAARFDTVGPLTRTVEDAGLVLAAIEGRRAPDLSGADLSGVRLAWLTGTAMGDLADAQADAFHRSVERLQAVGARVDAIELPMIDEALPLSAILYTSEAYGTWKEVIEAAPHKMYPQILERFRGGKGHLAADYVAAWQTIDRLRAAYRAATAGYDAILCPTTPNLPPNLARLDSDPDYYVQENLLTLRNTRIGNLMGLCALTLPTGVPSCGISLMAAPMAEDRLLRLGVAAEAALG